MSEIKTSFAVFGAMVGALLLGGVLLVGNLAFGWFSEGAAVVQEEYGPRAAVRKYEWFKDAAAQLSKKKADVKVLNTQIKELKTVPRDKMDRQDKQQLFQLTQERSGVIMSYNQLAAEYNAAMAKINYKFANIGELPAGADKTLPKNIAGYTEE